MSKKYREYLKYLESDHWKQLRREKIAIVGRQCQCCGKTGPIHVHHIRYKNYYDCTVDDLVVLLEECHNDFHNAVKYYKVRSEDYEAHQINGVVLQYRATPRYIRRKQRRAAPKVPQFKQPGNCRRAIRMAIKRCKSAHYNREAVTTLVSELTEILHSWPTSQPKPTDDLINVLLNYDATL